MSFISFVCRLRAVLAPPPHPAEMGRGVRGGKRPRPPEALHGVRFGSKKKKHKHALFFHPISLSSFFFPKQKREKSTGKCLWSIRARAQSHEPTRLPLVDHLSSSQIIETLSVASSQNMSEIDDLCSDFKSKVAPACLIFSNDRLQKDFRGQASIKAK